MSTSIGMLHFSGSPRLGHLGDLDVYVFDDAMVLIQGLTPKGGLAYRTLQNRGLLGMAVTASSVHRSMRHQREQAETAGDVSAVSLAKAVDGAEFIPLTAWAGARLEKGGLGKVCKLTLTTVSGKSETWRWNWKKNGPTLDEAADILGSALGERFVNAMTAPGSASQ